LSLVKQITEMFCYFRNLNASTKLKLLHSFRSSLYGAELWDLTRCEFQSITAAWRKALKRVWSLPSQTHYNILYSLYDEWPVEEAIIRISVLFGIRCESSVVRRVSGFGFEYGLINSVLGRNILFGCQKYVIEVVDYFVYGTYLFSWWLISKSCMLI